MSLDIIFLDIDGVLLPFGEKNCNNEEKDDNDDKLLFPKSTMTALDFILKKHPTVQIVLSSTWRCQPQWVADIEDCILRFQRKTRKNELKTAKNTRENEEGKSIVFDVTNLNNHTERQWEIQEWLEIRSHSHEAQVRSWVALDDEELLEGSKNETYRSQFIDHVVKTQSNIGLTMNDAKKVVNLIGKQIN